MYADYGSSYFQKTQSSRGIDVVQSISEAGEKLKHIHVERHSELNINDYMVLKYMKS